MPNEKSSKKRRHASLNDASNSSKKEQISNSKNRILSKKNKVAIGGEPEKNESKQLNDSTSISKVTNSDNSPLKTKNFRMIAGSYERILYGIDAKWIKSNEETKLHLKPIFIFPAHIGCIKTVAVGGRYLASGSTDEIIKLYDLKKTKELGSLIQHQGSITTLQFYNKSHMLSGSDDGNICIWRTKDWECLKTMKGHKGRVNSLAIHPSGKIALSVSNDKTVRLWNLMTGRKANSNKIGKEGEIVIWNTTGEQYAILMNNEIDIYSIKNAQVVHKFQQRSRYVCMKFYEHPELGELLVTGSEDKTINVYDVNDSKCLVTLIGHKNRVKAIDIIHSAPDEKSISPLTILVSVSSDGEINVWNLSEALEFSKNDNNKNQKIQENPSNNNTIAFTKILASYDTKSRLTCLVLSGGFGDVGDDDIGEDDNDDIVMGDEDNE
ncbi:11020_t:CDS:2 [Ambispora leptoticha]|uniref:11020_t:CDS:1 n=1 Tax=Ambispora leptoticha TaxID=144679 RepID=A0A9N8VDG5_9GLOM|nr:11020_t:CDS:2 [Ambispora leptoticha]